MLLPPTEKALSASVVDTPFTSPGLPCILLSIGSLFGANFCLNERGCHPKVCPDLACAATLPVPVTLAHAPSGTTLAILTAAGRTLTLQAITLPPWTAEVFNRLVWTPPKHPMDGSVTHPFSSSTLYLSLSENKSKSDILSLTSTLQLTNAPLIESPEVTFESILTHPRIEPQ